jgi:hypothetical protein
MNKTLLFLPDISGYTAFVQTTEISHSQHVIAELLEVMIEANTEKLQLAEIEGDALFFYKEDIPSSEKLLAQIETIFTAFYSHLKLFEKNRICPCMACSNAPNLQLKIIVHCGEIEFISVQNKRKPFGVEVIEVHRLMKNSIESNQYVLLTDMLKKEIALAATYQSKLFQLSSGKDSYDGKDIPYSYALIDKKKLKLKPFEQVSKFNFEHAPDVQLQRDFPIGAKDLLEVISNFSYRSEWVEGVDDFVFNPGEINRLGTEHVCVVNGKHINFRTITKDVEPIQLVYGELTETAILIDTAYQFYIITPLKKNTCRLEVEIYMEATSWIKKIMLQFLVKKTFQRNVEKAVHSLFDFVVNKGK